MISQLTSLNVGDAVLVGQWTNLPSMVHVEEVKEKKMGADQSATKAWIKADKMKNVGGESTQGLVTKRFVVRLMLFSHISDTHLGLIQYGSNEREQDVYDVFNQAIDISIKDHVDFVIFAGDIFHMPNPNGTAIIQMANALKRLKENNIDSFFILGEHDISRIRTTPIPYIYHNLGFSKYIGNGKPIEYKGIMLAGLDKIRKTEMTQYEEIFSNLDKSIEKFSGHKILVLHQGITEFNKFAGELQSTDLPKNFTYYAMGHLHDKDMKQFNHLKGPIVYPGSIELTTSEGIKDVKKDFLK